MGGNPWPETRAGVYNSPLGQRKEGYKPGVPAMRWCVACRPGRSRAYGSSNFGSAYKAYESNGARSRYNDDTASGYDDYEDYASNRWNYF